MTAPQGQPTSAQYHLLLGFHTALRRYLAWSNEQTAEAGLTPRQQELLLALRGHPGPRPPSVRELAGYLHVRPHSAVELMNRAQKAGLVRRSPDPDDHRVVRVRLTGHGSEVVATLAEEHLRELNRLTETLGLSEASVQQLTEEFARNVGGHPHA